MALDALIDVLKDNPTVIIELRSHTDFRAGTEFNLELSQRRAQICVDYMLSKGIEPVRIIPIGMGEKEPLYHGCKRRQTENGSAARRSIYIQY